MRPRVVSFASVGRPSGLIGRFGLMVALPMLLFLPACGSGRAPSTSDRGQRLCRQRQADLPPFSTPAAARQAYRECLRSIDAELAARGTPMASLPQAPASASAQDRYRHCRLVSSEVEAAYAVYSSAASRWLALADKPDDPDYDTARTAHEEAVAELERLIPPTMRGGVPLIPDAVAQFRRCDRANFR